LQQASVTFRDILSRHPREAAAVSGLGWALLELGRAKEASAEFERAISMDVNHGDAYIGLGTAHRQLGQLQDAYEAYDQYLGRFPKGPKASIASYQMTQLKKQLGM
jgi:Flp pilus assembly protein TadD